MRSPKAKLGTLLILLLCSFSLAYPQSPQPDLSDYANLARQAVADWLKGTSGAEQWRIEVGPLVVPGDHASLHQRPIPVGRSLRPFVFVEVRGEQAPANYLWVEFEASGPQVFDETEDEAVWEYTGEIFKTDPDFLELPTSVRTELLERLVPVFTISERRQVTSELAAFWDTWLDVARGPERLAPFLADEVECVFYPSYGGNRPSPDAGPCVSVLLESLAFSAWCDIESVCDSGGDTLEEQLVLIRNEWREAGLFDPQHFALVRPYLGRYLKEGVIWEVPAGFLKGLEQDSDPPLEPECNYMATQEEKIGCLNAWLSLLPEGFYYMVPLYERMLLFFGRKGTSLQLVAIMLGTWD